MSSQQDIDAFDMAYSDGYNKAKKEIKQKFLDLLNNKLFTPHNWSNRNNQWMITVGTEAELKQLIDEQ